MTFTMHQYQVLGPQPSSHLAYKSAPPCLEMGPGGVRNVYSQPYSVCAMVYPGVRVFMNVVTPAGPQE